MMSAAALATEKRIHVGQGEHHVTSDPSVMLTTILGSCVAMCLRDSESGIGGMNHFLLPEGAGAGPTRAAGTAPMRWSC
jgi:chemotaxis protein CheD